MDSRLNTKPVFKSFNLGVLLLVVSMLGMTIFPLPTFILDILFTFNIALSLIILLGSIYVVRPLEFSIFPTILLVTTLLRLTLNIASARIVLLNGHLGPDAAGQVIKAFGEVVIGGNFIVGMIIFAILLIINFVVVTKGAGRISEVSARFTLDAMPGKQMAIDSDLNAGVLTQDEAKRRRMEVMQEADFYGSMDGASKFVRGDAIAGLLILIINLVGGIVIAVFQHHMLIGEAVKNFSLLTIGDGLVAQIPSLLMSIAAAIMVTRVSNEQDITTQTISQLFTNTKPIFLTSAILFIFALIPNMPHMPFLGLAAILCGMGYWINHRAALSKQIASSASLEHDTSSKKQESADIDWCDVVSTDRITLEIGYGLIGLVGASRDGILIGRIRNIRKKLSHELGILIPLIHVRDKLSLPANRYTISLKNVVIAEADAYPDKVLAINPGLKETQLDGIHCKDPSFNLDACWIPLSKRDYATGLGYTVADCSTVIATHINQVIKTNAQHLLGYDEVQHILTRLTQSVPKLVETLTSGTQGVPLNVVVTVMQRLLAAGIPLIDMRTIAERMIDSWARIKDSDALYESVRIGLKNLIIYNICQNDKKVPVAVLDDNLAQILHKSIQGNQESGERVMMLEPSLSERIYSKLLEYVQRCEAESMPAVLLVVKELRPMFERLFKATIPSIHFISTEEIPEDRQITLTDRIG